MQAGLDPELRSTSGLTGGDGARLWRYAQSGGITGAFLNRAIAGLWQWQSTTPPWARS